MRARSLTIIAIFSAGINFIVTYTKSLRQHHEAIRHVTPLMNNPYQKLICNFKYSNHHKQKIQKTKHTTYNKIIY
jgi:hypothetical protein